MNAQSNAIVLPSPLQRRLEAAAARFIHRERGTESDFATPPGEPALTGPDSVSWQVFKNPLSLFVGGISAVILELAEPRVRSGVWHHTTFRQDPLTRLQRTGMAAMMTVYGPRSRAETMIAAVRMRHAKVHGLTPDGQAYRADDPELLTWVHATACFGFLRAYHVYVRPLPAQLRDRFIAESAPVAARYGAHRVPTSEMGLEALLGGMTHALQPSPIILEFLDIMLRVPVLPRIFAPVQSMLVRSAVELIPASARERVGLDRHWELKPWQRRAVASAGALADRLLLRASPAVQSCRRLGLPEDYLYRAQPEENHAALKR